jgi:hypothetical protein
MLRLERASKEGQTGAPEALPAIENRWCERHGYLIDLCACRARAEKRPYCRRCLARWQQLSLPFPNPC